MSRSNRKSRSTRKAKASHSPARNNPNTPKPPNKERDDRAAAPAAVPEPLAANDKPTDELVAEDGTNPNELEESRATKAPIETTPPQVVSDAPAIEASDSKPSTEPTSSAEPTPSAEPNSSTEPHSVPEAWIDETSATPKSANAIASLNASEVSTDPEVIERLNELLRRFDQLDGRLEEFSVHAIEQSTEHATDAGLPATFPPADSEELNQLRQELEEAWRSLEELQRSNEDLCHENKSLSSRLADAFANRTVQTTIGLDESLSWEDRKKLMMEQMEEDSFDANAFIESLSNQAGQRRASVAEANDDSDEDVEPQTPQQFVESLVQCITHLEETVADRNQEIGELKNLLQNQSNTWQSETRESGIAIGAAAIASLVDGDELVIEERQRLQQLKDDWEDKFRQTEIEASLERAKLSRERQELANRTRELEERLEEIQREKRTDGDAPVKGRRWLAELGLSSKEC